MHSGLTFNTNNNVTNVVLQGNNYKIVQKVQGTASGVSVLGIGGPFRAIVAKARSEMLKNANLVGHSRAIINETVEVNSKYFVLFGVKTITVSAYVIEFTGNSDTQQQSSQQINTQPQEIQTPVQPINTQPQEIQTPMQPINTQQQTVQQPQQQTNNNSHTSQPQIQSTLTEQTKKGYLNFNEFKIGTPSLTLDFQLNKVDAFNYEIFNINPKTDKGKINREIWGIRVGGDDYINNYPYTKIIGYSKIYKGYYSYFSRGYDIITGNVILPNGEIQKLTPQVLLQLCADNKDIIKEIQGTKIKDKDFNKMFEILRQYNLTKE